MGLDDVQINSQFTSNLGLFSINCVYYTGSELELKEKLDISQSVIWSEDTIFPSLGTAALVVDWLYGVKPPYIECQKDFVIQPISYGTVIPDDYINDFGQEYEDICKCQLNFNVATAFGTRLLNTHSYHINYYCDNLPDGFTLHKSGLLTGSTQHITKPTILKIKCKAATMDNTQWHLLHILSTEVKLLLVPFRNSKLEYNYDIDDYCNDDYTTFNGIGYAIPNMDFNNMFAENNSSVWKYILGIDDDIPKIMIQPRYSSIIKGNESYQFPPLESESYNIKKTFSYQFFIATDVLQQTILTTKFNTEIDLTANIGVVESNSGLPKIIVESGVNTFTIHDFSKYDVLAIDSSQITSGLVSYDTFNEIISNGRRTIQCKTTYADMHGYIQSKSELKFL